MSAERHTPSPRRRRAPAPSEAGTNLLVHDLKNLAGRLDLLGHNLAAHFDDPLFRGSALELLDETALHLRGLAGELREREGRLVAKLRVDLDRVLSDAVAERTPDLPAKVALEERYGGLPPIWGDAFLLRAAFACAIENALDAMEGEGTLSVRTRVERRRGRERVVVEIADTGPGMDEDYMRHCLARPFHSTKEDGLGLGLFTIRQVAALHDARVRIVSAPGYGTRVRFSFPAEED
jgi:signal transduction histidine kinase